MSRFICSADSRSNLIGSLKVINNNCRMSIFVNYIIRRTRRLIGLSILVIIVVVTPLQSRTIGLVRRGRNKDLLLNFPRGLAGLNLYSICVKKNGIIKCRFRGISASFLNRLFHRGNLSRAYKPVRGRAQEFSTRDFYTLLVSRSVSRTLLCRLFGLIRSDSIFRPSSFYFLGKTF